MFIILMMLKNSFASVIQFEKIADQIFTDFDSPNVVIKTFPGFE